jgi:hypothetical protein
MSQRLVTITDDDVAFVRRALEHYKVFAEVSDKQGEERMSGVLRKQQFYAERFLIRLGEEP